MNDQDTKNTSQSEQDAEHREETPVAMSDDEAAHVVGGTGSSYTPQQYDNWEAQGTADRSQHGPGSGE